MSVFEKTLQNYTKKTTYARVYAIFLQFYILFVIISPLFTLPVPAVSLIAFSRFYVLPL